MLGAIFYVYKKEVQKMNDLIELKLITREDAECLHKLQIEAFMPLYEKYQDDATSPAKESLETITKKIVDDNSDFYFILFNGEKAGAVRVKWHKGQKVHKNVNWISPIFVIPKFQNKGIASNVIKQLFDIYPNTIEWWLSTIKQEEKNCHLYEKCEFVRTGDEIVVNENMTLVFYVKSYIEVKAEAEEWERNFRQQQRKDLDINFENFVEIYFADVENRLRESTIKNKRYVFDLKVTPYFKKKKMCEIKTSDIRAWQNELIKQGYAPTYLRSINNQLAALFNYAVRRL